MLFGTRPAPQSGDRPVPVGSCPEAYREPDAAGRPSRIGAWRTKSSRWSELAKVVVCGFCRTRHRVHFSDAVSIVPGGSIQSASEDGDHLHRTGTEESWVMRRLSTRAARRRLSRAPRFLLLSVFLVVVGTPCLFHVALLPLAYIKLPREVWFSYYWFLAASTSVAFGETMAISTKGNVMLKARTVCLVVLFLTALATVLIVVEAIFFGGANTTLKAVRTPIFLFGLYLPFLMRLRPAGLLHGAKQLIPLLAMSFGAVPNMIAVALYRLFTSETWVMDKDGLVVASLAWAFCPFVACPVGEYLWRRTSVRDGIMNSMRWLLYCDIAFSLLGELVFLRSFHGAVASILSHFVVLAWLVVRGLATWQHMWRGGRRDIARGRLLMRAFMCTIGRSVSFVTPLCQVLLQLAPDAQARGTSLFNAGATFPSERVEVKIVEMLPFDVALITAVALGLVFVWLALWLFVMWVPSAWERSDSWSFRALRFNPPAPAASEMDEEVRSKSSPRTGDSPRSPAASEMDEEVRSEGSPTTGGKPRAPVAPGMDEEVRSDGSPTVRGSPRALAGLGMVRSEGSPTTAGSARVPAASEMDEEVRSDGSPTGENPNSDAQQDGGQECVADRRGAAPSPWSCDVDCFAVRTPEQHIALLSRLFEGCGLWNALTMISFQIMVTIAVRNMAQHSDSNAP